MDKQNLKGHLPKHVAIIMDGNRRWAKERGLSLSAGHLRGAEIIGDLVKGAAHQGIKTLTLFAFSTENWGRPQVEVDAIMEILERFLIQKRESLLRDGVRLDAIGDLKGLPEKVLKALNEAKEMTKFCAKINLVLALNYGGRDEICRAIKKILLEKISPNELTEEKIATYLDTASYGDPDLLIRTSGEMRISNFLLWQMSYTELYCTDVLWPDFTSEDLSKAVIDYQKRSRRLGG